MSDYIAARIRIGGRIPVALVPELCTVITRHHVVLDWGDAQFRPHSAEDLLEARREEDGIRLLWLYDDYLLWRATFQLLQQERAPNSDDRVLVNANGSPLWIEKMGDDGKYGKIDNVKSAFDRLQRKTKINKPFKSLKKASASLISGNEKYRGLESLFLGHAPSSMAEKHYAAVPQDLLDQAIEWLGREYGVL